MDGKQDLKGYQFNVDASVVSNWNSYMWLQNQKIPSSSFVIESHSGRGSDDCYRDEVVGLKPEMCEGNIALRALTKND